MDYYDKRRVLRPTRSTFGTAGGIPVSSANFQGRGVRIGGFGDDADFNTVQDARAYNHGDIPAPYVPGRGRDVPRAVAADVGDGIEIKDIKVERAPNPYIPSGLPIYRANPANPSGGIRPASRQRRMAKF